MKTRHKTGRANDDYLDLVIRFPLRLLRTQAELDEATCIFSHLAGRVEPLSPGEQDYMDALEQFIDAYEARQAKSAFLTENPFKTPTEFSGVRTRCGEAAIATSEGACATGALPLNGAGFAGCPEELSRSSLALGRARKSGRRGSQPMGRCGAGGLGDGPRSAGEGIGGTCPDFWAQPRRACPKIQADASCASAGGWSEYGAKRCVAFSGLIQHLGQQQAPAALRAKGTSISRSIFLGMGRKAPGCPTSWPGRLRGFRGTLAFTHAGSGRLCSGCCALAASNCFLSRRFAARSAVTCCSRRSIFRSAW